MTRIVRSGSGRKEDARSTRAAASSRAACRGAGVQLQRLAHGRGVDAAAFDDGTAAGQLGYDGVQVMPLDGQQEQGLGQRGAPAQERVPSAGLAQRAEQGFA